MLIEQMPDVLRWSSTGKICQRVHDSFVEVVGNALGFALRDICNVNRMLGWDLIDRVRSLPHSAVDRVVLAPETTSRVLWRRSDTLASTAEFLDRAFLAELARAGERIAVSREMWTALGDVRVLPSGEIRAEPLLRGLIPVDFDSPIAITYKLAMAANGRGMLRRPFDGSERELVLYRLGVAYDGIAATSNLLQDFVAKFTKVLVLVRDEAAPFTSESIGSYIGRSVIGNAHRARIDEVDVAEAIVHEAVHSLLYMQELRQPWVLAENLYDPIPVLVSPWTGTKLAVRPYLQAAFVWYALLHFWSLALVANTFAATRVRDQIRQASLGFMGQSLLRRLKEAGIDLKLVAPVVRTAIEGMEGHVRECFVSVIPVDA